MKTYTFSVKLDDTTAKKLLRLAQTTERSRGDVVRRLIRAATPDAALSAVRAGDHVPA